MKHILCPTDGSEYSLRAVTVAAQIAAAVKCKLSILVVMQYIVGRSMVAEMWTPEEAAKCLEQASLIAEDEGLPQADLVDLRASDVAHAILDFSEKNQVDHIVMGSQGKGGVKRFLIGSTSLEVLKKAICPVTIVR